MIEPAKFAHDRKQQEGWFDAEALPRLHDQLFDRSGGVAFEVQGRQTQSGHAVLVFKLRLEFNLRCQRCLGPLPFAQEVLREIEFVPGYDELDQDAAPGSREAADDEWTDAVPLVPTLDLQETIEEEVLLSLPLAAKHPENSCVPSGILALHQGELETPFAVLARMTGR